MTEQSKDAISIESIAHILTVLLSEGTVLPSKRLAVYPPTSNIKQFIENADAMWAHRKAETEK